ncbi:MAG: hypothetical protein HY822_01330 [Acidobacteria bacterium]|nr:hypothetical protein [Acidobacteriota bacterium]
MRTAGGLVLAALLCAQEQAPQGLVRGKLEGRIGTLNSGELHIRGDHDRIWVCAYNDKTYMERERLRIAAFSLKPGETIELVTDRTGGPCYARTLHVLLEEAPSRLSPRQLAELRSRRAAGASIVPRGNLTLAGIVLRLDGDALLLRTRTNRRFMVVLRQDTVYSAGGRAVNPAELMVNTRVSIRAGRNFEGNLEAYQVVWGEILLAR